MQTRTRLTRAVPVVLSTLLLTACLSDGKDDDGDDSSNSASGGGVQADSSGECQSCTESNCSSQQATCDSTDGCGDAIDCLLSCEATDIDCKLGCADQGGGLSNDALMAGNSLQTCLATSCLSPCWTPAGGDSSSGSSSGGSSSGSGSEHNALGSAQCDDCASSSCSAERSACDGAAGCMSVLECVTGCDPSDSACASGCSASADNLDAAAQQAGATYSACLVVSCANPCFGTSLDATSSGSGGTSTGGTTSPSATIPTGSTPSTTTTSDAPGSGGASSGTNWLSFDGDWADLSESPNDELNISGSMYAYGDSCATVDWDPTTRCLSGEICDPGSDFANWGVAVGFDFHNTGDEGSPANAKLTWDPAEVGAVGVTWRISGSAPGLQAWITNMAPSHGGTCTVDACEIDGPGDGTSSASNTGELRFNNLEKDYWGGSGVSYTFDPSDILSLQFKLPAVETGATSYSFCVDQIGIIR